MACLRSRISLALHVQSSVSSTSSPWIPSFIPTVTTPTRITRIVQLRVLGSHIASFATRTTPSSTQSTQHSKPKRDAKPNSMSVIILKHHGNKKQTPTPINTTNTTFRRIRPSQSYQLEPYEQNVSTLEEYLSNYQLQQAFRVFHYLSSSTAAATEDSSEITKAHYETFLESILNPSTTSSKSKYKNPHYDWIDYILTSYKTQFQPEKIPIDYIRRPLKHAIKSGKIQVAQHFLKMYIQQGYKLDIDLFNAFLRYYQKRNDLEGALAFYNRMNANNIQPDLKTFNTLFLLCTSSPTPKSEALLTSLYKDMTTKFNLVPNVVVYTTLLRHYFRTNQLEKMNQFIQEIESREIQPDAVLYNVLLSIYAKTGNTESCEKVFKEMKERHIDENDRESLVYLYTSLINGYVEAGDLVAAENALERMESDGITPNEVTYSALIKGYLSADNTALTDSQPNATSLPPTISKPLSFFQKMSSKMLPIPFDIYRNFMNHCISTHHAKTALDLYNDLLLKREARLPTSIYNLALAAYVQLNDPEMAKHVFDHIPNPNLISYENLLSAYLNTNGVLDAVRLITICTERQLELSTDSYRKVLETCWEACRWRDGVYVLRCVGIVSPKVFEGLVVEFGDGVQTALRAYFTEMMMKRQGELPEEHQGLSGTAVEILRMKDVSVTLETMKAFVAWVEKRNEGRKLLEVLESFKNGAKRFNGDINELKSLFNGVIENMKESAVKSKCEKALSQI